jgi:hypothetical protein
VRAQLAIRNDEELHKLFKHCTIADGGVLPNIHAVLMPKDIGTFGAHRGAPGVRLLMAPSRETAALAAAAAALGGCGEGSEASHKGSAYSSEGEGRMICSARSVVRAVGGDPSAAAGFTVLHPLGTGTGTNSGTDSGTNSGANTTKGTKGTKGEFKGRLSRRRSSAPPLSVGAKGRQRLMRHLDHAAADAPPAECRDFKMTLTRAGLTALVGAGAVGRLYARFERFEQSAGRGRGFGGGEIKIKLRRCAAYGECINFHLDHAVATMQVALNGDGEYCGGRLVFAGEGGFVFPARPAGTITIHDDTMVHGVTKMESGVRYGLFLLAV